MLYIAHTYSHIHTLHTQKHIGYILKLNNLSALCGVDSFFEIVIYSYLKYKHAFQWYGQKFYFDRFRFSQFSLALVKALEHHHILHEPCEIQFLCHIFPHKSPQAQNLLLFCKQTRAQYHVAISVMTPQICHQINTVFGTNRSTLVLLTHRSTSVDLIT